jgi:hypothetical protein
VAGTFTVNVEVADTPTTTIPHVGDIAWKQLSLKISAA